MNKQQRRKQEKPDRATKKYTLEDVRESRKEAMEKTVHFTVEKLMACFAYTLRKEYGFGKKRIMKALRFIDDYAGMINNGEITLDEICKRLEDEVGAIIRCDD